MNTWDLIKIQLKSTLSTDSYQNWVSDTEFSHIQDNKLCVTVPNEETRAWMATEYSGFVNSVIRELGLGLSSVVYELARPTVESLRTAWQSRIALRRKIFSTVRGPR
jgi:chromosomal replication initiation ATPase DnaA